MALTYKTYKAKDKRPELEAAKVKEQDLAEVQAIEPAAMVGDFFIQQDYGPPVYCPAANFTEHFEEKV